MHGKVIVQTGGESLSEGGNMNFHKNAKRLEQRSFAIIISIRWAE